MQGLTSKEVTHLMGNGKDVFMVHKNWMMDGIPSLEESVKDSILGLFDSEESGIEFASKLPGYQEGKYVVSRLEFPIELQAE